MSHYHIQTGTLAEKIANTRDTTRAEPEYLRTPGDLMNYLHGWNIGVERAPNAQDLADVLVLRERLRALFESTDLEGAATVMNDLLAGARAIPHVGLTAEGTISLKLAIDDDLPLARQLGAEAVLSLIPVLEQYGIDRFQTCNATPCTEVYIDTSRNRTRRYCCEQCANRHNVAAFRRRKKST